MKLRNKKTGEIKDVQLGNHNDPSDGIIVLYGENGQPREPQAQYSSLAELNEEWEDYEEPKEHWTIGHDGAIFKLSEWENQKDHEEIGNYFETEEEAEKAVEKLKAWKRLKNKGFRFDVVPALGHCDDEKFDISIIATMPAKWWYNDKVIDDIHYIFGGEE